MRMSSHGFAFPLMSCASCTHSSDHGIDFEVRFFARKTISESTPNWLEDVLGFAKIRPVLNLWNEPLVGSVTL